MTKSSPQILPCFTEAFAVSRKMLHSSSLYDDIYGYQAMNTTLTGTSKYAWLIDESISLSDFIDGLGQADVKSGNHSPLNLYDFYAAVNISFPVGAVSLINEICIERENINDLAGLVNAFACSRVKYLQHAVIIYTQRVPDGKVYALRRRILQQFVYLRIYMPVILAEGYAEADRKFQAVLYPERVSRSISVFGTKKSGKSTLINAMLGGEYLPYSSELPTPCRVVCFEGGKDENIRLEYGGNTYIFADAGELREFLSGEFSEANKNSSVLEEMRISLPVFPERLRNISIIDTPGSNFAPAGGHHEAAFEALDEAEGGIFVLNYSAHLSNDEAELLGEFFRKFGPPDENKPVLIAVNRLDEMYAAKVVKSYERAADYIASRLEGLGWRNFLIVPVSALTGIYAEKLGGSVEFSVRKLSERLEKIEDWENESAALFLTEKLREQKRFYGIEIRSMLRLAEVSRVKYFVHMMTELC